MAGGAGVGHACACTRPILRKDPRRLFDCAHVQHGAAHQQPHAPAAPPGAGEWLGSIHGVYCCDFLLLPIALCCSQCLLLVVRRSKHTPRHKLPLSHAVSYCLPMSTTRLSYTSLHIVTHRYTSLHIVYSPTPIPRSTPRTGPTASPTSARRGR